MSKKTFKPGERTPVSGWYGIVGARGGKGSERTVVEAETFPSTPKAGSKNVVVEISITK
jgi:hypothetical protein